jgi:mannose-6-phosphate isomerase-like protein (cupin superfamily)
MLLHVKIWRESEKMEIINIPNVKEFRESKVVKKVPILTDQMMATLLLVPPNTMVPAHSHSGSDEVHYIISGSGKITIGKQSEKVKEGMLILVPKTEFHYFSTLKDPLIILSNSPVCEPHKGSPKRN